MSGNPGRILRTLDGFLLKPASLYVFGRSALALGFAGAPAEFFATLDVDALLPARDLAAIEADAEFWAAIEKTNRELAETDLYLTHLFEDRQVVLSKDWLEHAVPIVGPIFFRLRLFRPRAVDLVLTKMMRDDPQDRADIDFLLQAGNVTAAELESAFVNALVPDVPEIAEIYERMKPIVRARLRH